MRIISTKKKIVFTLDDVIRAKTFQIGNVYKKYVDKTIDLPSLDLSSGNMQEIFGFKDKDEYNKWLYEDYAFEVFGEAPTTEKSVDKKMNLWLIDFEDNKELSNKYEMCISNPYEFNASIGFTYFFLAKIATRIREAFFPANSQEIWNAADVLITSDPILLQSKVDPKNQVSVKIETDYNKDVDADITYSSLSELLDDKDFFEKINKK